MNSYQKLKNTFKRISHLQYLHHIATWDEAVMMPPGAGHERSKAIATLTRQTQQLLVSPKMKRWIQEATIIEPVSEWDKVNFAYMEKLIKRADCIPLPLVEKATFASLQCEQMWRTCRSENNWQAFLPCFEKSFALVKEIAERRSAVFNLSPYDALLDDYAPGFNEKTLDPIFTDLKTQLTPLLATILEKQTKEKMIKPQGEFSTDHQYALGLKVMSALGFDFQHGRLDVSHHPFCSGGPRDVRITTRYAKTEFVTSLMAVCHETGHGLFEQGLPSKWLSQPVGHIHSMAVHESQSLLYEMEVCHSQAFSDYLIHLIHSSFPACCDMTARDLHTLITRVSPSFIRVNADEVSYPLHIILRYELEKALFKGEIQIKDLPFYWDKYMQDYLNLSTLGKDQDGVMQDVHWPSGAFGYFPAYTIGRLIAAQLFATFQKSAPTFFADVKQGNFTQLQHWLKKNVYDHASLLPTQTWLQKVTGEPLSTNFFIEGLKKRYN
ncbi:MAG: carboxypeptidase M32 [Gammaproteobacteria bacterium]|nr:carboxypeptidase M32 [Gammaproteobacteria bacterium]